MSLILSTQIKHADQQRCNMPIITPRQYY